MIRKNMDKIKPKEQKILAVFLKNGILSSSSVYGHMAKMGEEISLVTVKRTLSRMAAKHLLEISGSGRTTSYRITSLGRIFTDINAKEYCLVEPDKRYGQSSFNFQLLSEWPDEAFMDQEFKILNNAAVEYQKRTTDLPASIQKKELERLIIELSWKSSKIEGNTYTLLDTEKLILEHKESPGHDKKEAIMILNHKDAFNFIHENKGLFKTLNRTNLEKLHAVLMKDLSADRGFREKPVGITGSKYRPLDNVYQIQEAIEQLGKTVSRVKTVYDKAFAALLGISYIQPFGDGNKRTSRLMANALLLAYGHTPLSYRSIDENEYREATLVFYELNSITLFKRIFINQYDFAAKNYAVK